MYQVMCSCKQDTMVSSSQPNFIRSVMDIHIMQHLYIVRKNIRATLIDTTLYLRDVCNSWPQLLKLWQRLLETLLLALLYFVTL